MTTKRSAIIHVDGGSRGNPGPAGYGFIVLRDGLPPLRGNGRLGHATNNVAEYTGLVRALEKAAELQLNDLLIRSDSELLVKQMNGQYRVKNEQLQELFAKAQRLARQIGEVRFVHVYREQNAEADRLANLAMDGTLVDGDTDEAESTPPTVPLPSLKEATRSKKETKSGGWDQLRAAYLRAGVAPPLVEQLLTEAKELGFKPPRST